MDESRQREGYVIGSFFIYKKDPALDQEEEEVHILCDAGTTIKEGQPCIIFSDVQRFPPFR
jgi:hypothetical protein